MIRIIKIKEVTDRVGWSQTTVWRHERDGTFPKRIRLGPNSVGWDEAEIEAWLESRPRGMASDRIGQ